MQTNNKAYKTKDLGGRGIMNMIDQLFQFFIARHADGTLQEAQKYVINNRDLKSEEKIVAQILQNPYIGNDSELASKEIQNCIDASIKVSNMIQKCYNLHDSEEFLNYVEIKLWGLHEKVELFTKFGLSKPYDTSKKYIRNTHFQKKDGGEDEE